MFLENVVTQNDINSALVGLMVGGCILIFFLIILIIVRIFINLSHLSRNEKINNYKDIIKELNENEKK